MTPFSPTMCTPRTQRLRSKRPKPTHWFPLRFGVEWCWNTLGCCSGSILSLSKAARCSELLFPMITHHASVALRVLGGASCRYPDDAADSQQGPRTCGCDSFGLLSNTEVPLLFTSSEYPGFPHHWDGDWKGLGDILMVSTGHIFF